MRALAWLALSLVLHAALLALWPRTGRRLPAPPIPVAVTFRDAPHVTATSAALGSGPVRHFAAGSLRHGTLPRAAPAETPGPSAPPSAPSREPVELFPDGVIAAQSAVKPSWGGKTRRAGDLPERDDREDEAARVGSRVDALLGRARGESEVAGGRVDPAWRDLERAIDAGFRPPADAISSDSALVGLAKQMRNLARGGPTPRGVDPSRAAEPGVFIAEQIAASQAAFAEPSEWRTTEITVELDADGRLVDARVALGSGRAALDREALEAVRRALARHPLRDPRGRVTARFSVEAAVAITPPAAGAMVDPVSGRVVGGGIGLGFRFDESLRKFEVDVPFTKRVRTRVRLVSLEPH
jgi:TonB family protein